MIKSDPSRFKAGTELRFPIKDEKGVLLLNSGAVLTENVVTLLYRRGISLILSAKLEVVEGGLVGTELAIIDASTTVGRSDTCHICPNDQSVSSIHCAIEKLPLSLYVKDLNSTNGTRVNGETIEGAVELKDKDIIGFGDFAVRVHLYAALESTGPEAKEVAHQILANNYGSYEVPFGKATMEMSRQDLLDAANE